MVYQVVNGKLIRLTEKEAKDADDLERMKHEREMEECYVESQNGNDPRDLNYMRDFNES